MSKASIGKSTIILTASKGLSLVMNMLCVMVLSRIRTLDEYGTYSQLLMSVSLLSTLLLLGLPNSINYFLGRAEDHQDRRNFLHQYYSLNLILSALVGVILVLGIPALEWYYKNPAIGEYAFFLLLYPFASLTMSSVENVLVVYDRTDTLIGYRFFNSLALLLSVLVADWTGMSFRGYMIVFLAVQVLFGLWVYVLVRRLAEGLRFRIDKSQLRTILAFSVPLGLASSVGTLSRELDKLTISALFSTEEYAIFTNAAKELPLTILAASTTAVIMPKIALLLKRKQKEQAVSLWRESFALNYAVIALPVFGIITFAPEAMIILYSEKYLPGVSVFRVYALLELLRCTYWGMLLNATGNSRYIFRNSIYNLALNVVLNILFYMAMGFIGPAIATVVSTFILAAIMLRKTAKALDISTLSMLPLSEIGKISLLNLALAVVFYAGKALLPLDAVIGTVAESVILGGIWSLAYAVLVFGYVKSKWHTINHYGELDA